MANVTIVNQPTQVQTVSPAGGQTQNAPDAGKQTATLSQGTILSGTIVGKDANGNFVLRTASDGNVSLHSATPLTYNSDVEVRIGSSGVNGTTARILTVNGQAFGPTSAQPQEESDSLSDSLLAQASQSTPAGATQTQATATQTVRAVVVPAPAAPATPAPNPGNANPQAVASEQAGNLNSGDNVILHVQAQPQVQEQAQQSPVATAQQTDSAPAAPVTTSEQVISAPQPLNVFAQTVPTAQQGVAVPQSVVSATATELSGAQVVAQVNGAEATNAQQASPQTAAAVAQTPQSQAQAAPSSNALYAAYAKQSGTANAPAPAQTAAAGTQPPASQGSLVQAQVANVNENGTVTLQTPSGNVTVQPESLPAGVTLTTGSSVQIELPGAAGPLVAAAPAISTAPAPLSEIALGWATLKDIISTTDILNNPAAQAPENAASAQANPVLANLPQLGTNFASSSMAFISAVAEGNMRKLLGDDTIESLKENGRGDLVEKFSMEVGMISQSMSQAAARPMPGWQMIFMPFVYQEALQQARIYIKREPAKKEKSSPQSQGDTRFVVEVDLSEIGPLQMDGLVRKHEKATAFDLVIRSRTGFSQQQKNEISAIYADAASMTGFKGGLTFQVTHNFPVKPLDDLSLSAAHNITV